MTAPSQREDTQESSVTTLSNSSPDSTRTDTRYAGSRTDLRWRFSPVALPWLVALLMLLTSIILFPSSIEFGGLATLTPLLGVLVIASLGQSLVIGSGGIDLSVSSVITLVGIVFVKVSGAEGGSISRGVIAAVAVALICGTVNGILVEKLRLSPLVVTLATGQIMLGIGSIWYEGGVNRMSVPTSWKELSTSTLDLGISYVLLIGLAIAAVVAVGIAFTAAGRRLTAASTSVRASAYQGIRSLRYRISTYVAASLLYALAGLLLVGNIGTPTLTLGEVYQLSTVVAVVLGGAALTGGRIHPAATIAGALFLALINQNVAASGIAAGTQSVIQGAVLILAMTAAAVIAWVNIRSRRIINRKS